MTKRSKGWRVLPHTAEIALEITGASWPSFFRNAARGLCEIYGFDPAPIDPRRKQVKKKFKAATPEELLVDWLNELIFLVSTKGWRPGGVRILEAGKCCLTAELASAEEIASPKLEIKAATFSALNVVREKGRIAARLILDV